MKIKTLFLSVILSFAFTNVCEAQLGKLISTGIKAAKEAKQKNKQSQESSASDTDNSNLTQHVIENPKDEIALTVSADGATKEEATKIALRSAIEQAYGAFVSANTTILNDEMVKDEIVTISNGNIKSYQEVASALLPNGRITVTLNAIVSISKLTSYAQSKGATTEFAGATFAMNVKMMELNKQNEMKALDNLILQIKEILPTAFDLELIVGEPQLYSNRNPFSEYNRTINYVYNVSNMSRQEYDSLYEKINFDNYYTLPINIIFRYNENLTTLWDLISSTLKSVEPSKQECAFFKDTWSSTYTVLGLIPESKKEGFHLRAWKTRLNSNEVKKYNAKINEIIIDVFSDFVIIDNTGTKSSFDAKGWGKNIAKGWFQVKNTAAGKCFMDGSYYSGTGIFSPLVANCESFRQLFRRLYDEDISYPYSLGVDDKIEWHLNVLIPKGDISKYSSFTIQHKSK